MGSELNGIYLDIPEQLSLGENDILFIASDVRQLALDARTAGTNFNANEFIEAFQRQLSNGTIVIPAYTDNLKNGDTFDHVKGKPTTGALSNKVFRRKDFIRSRDPLHSVFAWGKGAEQIASLDGESSLGEGSIFEWMLNNRAKMLCIDVHFQNSLTFVHYTEELRRVKYRKAYHWKIKRLFADGSDVKSFVFYSRQPWVLTDLELLQSSAVEDGVARQLTCGNSNMLLFEIEEMHRHIEKLLDRGDRLYRVSLKHFAKTMVKRIIGRS